MFVVTLSPCISRSVFAEFIDNKLWVGDGFTIPPGPLREGLSDLKRPNCVGIHGEYNREIENKIFSKNKEIKIFYAKYRTQNINEFRNKKVIAFAVIGKDRKSVV